MPEPLMPPPPLPLLPSARGSRVAGIAATPARLMLAGLAAILLLVSVMAARAPVVPEGQSAATIDRGLIVAVLSGGDYYLAATEALHAAGRPAGPFGIRLPILTVTATIVPPWLSTGLMALLGLAVAVVWYRRLATSATQPGGRVAGLLLPLAGAAAVVLRPEAALVHEGWAGLFVALSLGLRQPGRIAAMVALGLVAALLQQIACLYLVGMLVFALGERRRDEALGWAVALGVFVLVLGVHGWAAMRADGLGLWTEAPVRAGPIAAIRALAGTTLPAVTMAIAAPIVVLALASWIARADASAGRGAALVAGFLLVAAWGPDVDVGEAVLLAVPLSLVGSMFAYPVLCDLAHAALDRRRFVVTRIVR